MKAGELLYRVNKLRTRLEDRRNGLKSHSGLDADYRRRLLEDYDADIETLDHVAKALQKALTKTKGANGEEPTGKPVQ